jgi:hypothetical protein
MLYLTRCGRSIGEIAIAQTLSFLPMAFKSLLSVPSDLTRLRRPFVFCGLVLSASCFFFQLIESAASTRGFILYIFFIMLRNAGAGVSDCAGDGLIIDADVEPLSGTISAYQGIGRMSGLILSTIIGQQIADRFGFESVLVELGFWMMLTAPVAGIVREELEPSPLGQSVNAAIGRVTGVLTCGGRLGAALGAIARFLAKAVPAPAAALASQVSAKLQSWGGVDPLLLQPKGTAGASGVPPPGFSAPQPLPLPLPAAGGPLTVSMNPLQASRETAAPGASAAAGASSRQARVAALAAARGDSGGGDASANARSGRAPNSDDAAPSSRQEPEPESAPATQLTSREAFTVLWRHCQHTSVAAFVAFMFFGQGATFLANFSFVVWLDEQRDFSVAEVGSVTIAGAVGNALGSYGFGLLFDRFAEKRFIHLTCVLLSIVPYTILPFLPSKPAIFAVYFGLSAGYGGLYTVQVSQMRLLADRTVAASYAGLCMGMLALSAAVGTVVGGAVGEFVSLEAVFYVGCAVGCLSALLIPWITSIDPEMVALKRKQREERRRRAAARGKRLRRRSSFRDLLAAARGGSGGALLLGEEEEEEREEERVRRAKRAAAKLMALERSEGSEDPATGDEAAAAAAAEVANGKEGAEGVAEEGVGAEEGADADAAVKVGVREQ